jgi:hypothetical protein
MPLGAEGRIGLTLRQSRTTRASVRPAPSGPLAVATRILPSGCTATTLASIATLPPVPKVGSSEPSRLTSEAHRFFLFAFFDEQQARWSVGDHDDSFFHPARGRQTDGLRRSAGPGGARRGRRQHRETQQTFPPASHSTWRTPTRRRSCGCEQPAPPAAARSAITRRLLRRQRMDRGDRI